MYEHTLIEHVGNFSVICLAVILATAVHYAMLKRLNAGGKFIERYPRWRLLYMGLSCLLSPTSLKSRYLLPLMGYQRYRNLVI